MKYPNETAKRVAKIRNLLVPIAELVEHTRELKKKGFADLGEGVDDSHTALKQLERELDALLETASK